MNTDWQDIRGIGKVKLQTVEYHRNGISGNGFFVILFDQKDGHKNMPMMGILFDQRGSCAILNREMLQNNDVAFASNSWRGDVYEDFLRKASEEYFDK